MKKIFSLFVALLAWANSASALTFGGETQISTNSSHQLMPQIVGADGALHMTWLEYNAGLAPGIVFYTRSTNNGTTWEPPRAVSAAGVDAYWPSISVSGNNVNVFWNTDPNNGRVFQARSANGGVTFSTPTVVSVGTPAGRYARAPRTLADASGRIHVLWYDSRDSASVGRLYHRLSCDGGANWGPETSLSRFDGDVDDESPDIAQTSDGMIYVLFRSTRLGRPQGGWPPFTKFLLRGDGVDCATGTVNWRFPAQPVSPAPTLQHAPTHAGGLAAGASGRLHMAYWDMAAGTNVVYRRSLTTTSGFDAPVAMSSLGLDHPQHFGVTAEVSRPAIAEAANGSVHVFFAANQGLSGPYQSGALLYRESTDAGASFGASTTLAASAAFTPSAVAHGGRVHLVWADGRNPSLGPRIYYRFANESGVVDANADTDGDGVPDGIETTQGTNPLVKDNDIFNNATRFVQQQYRDFLFREGDAGGVSFWANQINAGQASRAQMAESYFTSAEFQSVSAPIIRLYLATYLRIPDTGGLLFWIGEYRKAPTRANLEAIATQFATAPEFVQRYGNVSNQAYVSLLYQNILGRPADSAGLSFWTGELDRGVTRGVMLANFAESAEFQAAKFADTYVIAAYVGMLRRAPDQAGYDFYTARIRAGQSGLELVNQFLQSAEYRARFLP